MNFGWTFQVSSSKNGWVIRVGMHFGQGAGGADGGGEKEEEVVSETRTYPNNSAIFWARDLIFSPRILEKL